MRKQIFVGLLALMISSWIGSIGWAQGDTEPTAAASAAVSDPSVEQRLADLETEIRSLREQLADAANPPVPVDTGGQAAQAGAEERSVYEQPAGQQRTSAQDWTTWLEVKFADIENKLAGLEERLYSLDQAVRGRQPTAGTLADGSTAEREATFIISNYTGMDQYVSVNGQRRYYPPGRTEVQVPYGNVTTELVGFEAPRTWNNWRLNGDRYQMELQIKQ